MAVIRNVRTGPARVKSRDMSKLQLLFGTAAFACAMMFMLRHGGDDALSDRLHLHQQPRRQASIASSSYRKYPQTVDASEYLGSHTIKSHRFKTPARSSIADAPNHLSFEGLNQKFDIISAQIKQYKKNLPEGVFMETQPEALALTGELQSLARALIWARYGEHENYDVQLKIRYPEYMTPDPGELQGTSAHFTIRMEDVTVLPVAVFAFLELARNFESGEMNRNAEHIIQFHSESSDGQMSNYIPFQEYHNSLPHVEGSVGFSGRPCSVLHWYINIVNNSEGHGPGSQQEENPYEADVRFGHIIEGYGSTIYTVHTTTEIHKSGFLDEDQQPKIEKMRIFLVDGDHRVEYDP